jgi:hypothetical protein
MTLRDAQLGELTFDSGIGWWEGRVTLPSGATFALYVHTPRETDQSITEAARSAFEKMKGSEQAAREFAARELLPVHNDHWSDEKGDRRGGVYQAARSGGDSGVAKR